MHFFCLFPFPSIRKSIFTNLGIFFLAYRLFQILKNVYISVLKNLTQFFRLSSFSNIKKVYLQILTQFFRLFPFSNNKKGYFQILKNLAKFFCLSPFSNIQKTILANFKKRKNIFSLIIFFKY